MKILVITRNAWDNTNSIGNTISNLFADLKNIQFANIYFREAYPNNELCYLYYHCTEFDIIKNWFFPTRIGRKFCSDNDSVKNQAEKLINNEKKIINYIHRRRGNIAYKLSNIIWYRKKWINSKIRKFVEEFKPDLMFTFVKSSPQYYLTVRFLREVYNIPLFTFIADDEYTALKKGKREREINKLNYLLKESSFVCGCSQEICQYYSSIFPINAIPLYKGCTFTNQVKRKVGSPVKFIYAGNLLYGRLEIIKMVSDIIQSVNHEILFDIYSNTELSLTTIDRSFGTNDRTKYKGRHNYEFIKNELAKADIVIHVESFNESEIIKTKYSFSTKIIDYLQSGSVLLAIGPSDTSSIIYAKSIPGTFVIDDLKQVRSGILNILRTIDTFPKRAEMIREFAEKNHSNYQNVNRLENILCDITKKEK